MRLVQFRVPDGIRVGSVKDGGIIDLWEMATQEGNSVVFESMEGWPIFPDDKGTSELAFTNYRPETCSTSCPSDATEQDYLLRKKFPEPHRGNRIHNSSQSHSFLQVLILNYWS